MRFMLDENLPPKIARALNELSDSSDEVTYLRKRYPERTADETWLRELGKEGNWVVVSADKGILNKLHEREAWNESGLTAFFLERGWLSLKLWEKAWKLVKYWPDIVDTARKFKKGSGFLLAVGGKLKSI